MIGIWIKEVVISPTDLQIAIADETIDVPTGKVLKRGYIGDEGIWQLYKNGYLEIKGNYISAINEYPLPFDEYKEDIRYINVEVPIKEIRDGWFLNYKNLEAVLLPTSLEYISNNAFQGCEKLENFSFSDEGTNFYCEDGIIFSKEKSELVCCPISKIENCLPHVSYGKEWYIPLLTNRKVVYLCTQWSKNNPLIYYSNIFKYYALFDINGDGIEELFFSTDPEPCVDGTIIMVTVDSDGEVHCLESIQTINGYFRASNNFIISYIRAAGTEHYVVEEYSGESLEQIYDLYISEESGNPVYHSGDVIIDKKEYTELIQRYVNNSQYLEYKALPN